MPGPRHHLRIALTAFAAVGALSWVAGNASASVASSPTSTRSCCVKRACTICCCEPGLFSRSGQPAERLTPLGLNGAGLVGRASLPCECSSHDPAGPADHRAARQDERSRELDQGVPEVGELGMLRSRLFARPFLAPSRFSKSPLHLRSTRLRI